VTAGTLASPLLAVTIGVGAWIAMPTAIAVLAGVFVALVQLLVVAGILGDQRYLPVAAAASYLGLGVAALSASATGFGVAGVSLVVLGVVGLGRVLVGVRSALLWQAVERRRDEGPGISPVADALEPVLEPSDRSLFDRVGALSGFGTADLLILSGVTTGLLVTLYVAALLLGGVGVVSEVATAGALVSMLVPFFLGVEWRTFDDGPASTWLRSADRRTVVRTVRRSPALALETTTAVARRAESALSTGGRRGTAVAVGRSSRVNTQEPEETSTDSTRKTGGVVGDGPNDDSQKPGEEARHLRSADETPDAGSDSGSASPAESNSSPDRSRAASDRGLSGSADPERRRTSDVLSDVGLPEPNDQGADEGTDREPATGTKPPGEVSNVVERVQSILEGDGDVGNSSAEAGRDEASGASQNENATERDAGDDEDAGEATDGRDDGTAWVDQLESPDV